eukprot:jgi/Botrbrau1/6605/Bobra.0189s0032.1
MTSVSAAALELSADVLNFLDKEASKMSNCDEHGAFEDSFLRRHSAPEERTQPLLWGARQHFPTHKVLVKSLEGLVPEEDWSSCPSPPRTSYSNTAATSCFPRSSEPICKPMTRILTTAASDAVKEESMVSGSRLERKRKSNRESAKRMRILRQIQLSTLQDQVKQLQVANKRLAAKALENEETLNRIPLLVRQCKQLLEERRQLMLALSAKSLDGHDNMQLDLPERSTSLDSAIMPSSLRASHAKYVVRSSAAVHELPAIAGTMKTAEQRCQFGDSQGLAHRHGGDLRVENMVDFEEWNIPGLDGFGHRDASGMKML